jgi:hypothetical protein
MIIKIKGKGADFTLPPFLKRLLGAIPEEFRLGNLPSHFH